jgi:hypothetical protein
LDGVARLAYRFVPVSESERPAHSNVTRQSQYTLLAADQLKVGDRITEPILGYEEWEVVELLPQPGPLLEARDASGEEIPLAGSAICRAVR